MAHRNRAGRQKGTRSPSCADTDAVARAILALQDDPFPRGGKKLKNRDGWRIRVGEYRILYFADTKARQIVIGVIGHRREVYRD